MDGRKKYSREAILWWLEGVIDLMENEVIYSSGKRKENLEKALEIGRHLRDKYLEKSSK